MSKHRGTRAARNPVRTAGIVLVSGLLASVALSVALSTFASPGYDDTGAPNFAFSEGQCGTCGLQQARPLAIDGAVVPSGAFVILSGGDRAAILAQTCPTCPR